MPKLQTIIAVPNFDNFNSGKREPAKIFPSRPSVVPQNLYEDIERPTSTVPIPTASLPMMARMPKTKYLQDYMTVDTRSLVNQKIIERPMSAKSIERPMSAMSSHPESPPSDYDVGSGGGGTGKTSLRLVTSQARNTTGERSASSGESGEGTRASSRRSTSEYSRVGDSRRSTSEYSRVDDGLEPLQDTTGSGRTKRKYTRKSVNFDNEEERPRKLRRESSVTTDVVINPDPPKKYVFLEDNS
jgi:hypothetical protein